MRISLEGSVFRFLLLGLVLSLVLAVPPISAQTPQINPGGVVNAASYAQPGVLTPSVIFSIFGTSLTDGSNATAFSTPLPTSLAGARVLVNGIPAPLFFASPNQINAQFPVELTGISSARVQVEVQTATGSVTGPSLTVLVDPLSPGIFTWNQDGHGPGAILRNSDFSKICPTGRADCTANPAARGDVVAIYMTGLGEVREPAASGQPATVASPTRGLPEVTIGGVGASVLFSGLASGFVGLYQVNVRVPASAPTGDNVPLSVRMTDLYPGHRVTIAILGPPQPLGGGPVGADVSAIAVDSLTPQTVYAADSLGGVFKSTNGGANWTLAGLSSLNVRALAIDPANPTTLYAGTHLGIFKSLNGGQTWAAANSGIIEDRRIDCLAVNPLNASVLYAGGSSGFYKSTDGGGRWSFAESGFPGPFGPLIISVAIDPVQSATLYAGSADTGSGGLGVFKSTNAAGSWSSANTGLPSTSARVVNHLAINRTNPSTIYAGTDSGVFKTTNAAASWTASSSGLPTSAGVLSLAIDPVNPATLYVATSGGVFKSTDAGASWSASNSGLPAIPVSVRALTVAPSTPVTIYAGTRNRGIFKSADGGQTWQPTGPD